MAISSYFLFHSYISFFTFCISFFLSLSPSLQLLRYDFIFLFHLIITCNFHSLLTLFLLLFYGFGFYLVFYLSHFRPFSIFFALFYLFISFALFILPFLHFSIIFIFF